MPTSKEKHKAAPAPKKVGRPFKRQSANVDEPAPQTDSAPVVTPLLAPPSIPFRSFKIAMVTLKDLETLPIELDRTVWTNKLLGTGRRETVAACRFLGLIDHASKPTPSLQKLVAAVDTAAWPAELRQTLEHAYEPLLACSISELTAGGMLRTFRTLYRTTSETTRKSCNFFVHAAREASLEIGPLLITNSRSRWSDRGRAGSNKPSASRTNATRISLDALNADSLSALVGKLPAYEPAWPDDVKRLWFSALNNLIERLDPDLSPD